MLRKYNLSTAILTLFSVLAVLLPINNLISQILTNKLHLPDLFLLWKEVIVLILIGLMYTQVFQKIQTKTAPLNILRNTFIYLIISSGIIINSLIHSIPIREIFLGFRVELLWVGLFVATYTWLKTVTISYQDVQKYILKPIYLGFFFVLTLVIGSHIFSPQAFYTFLGYSNGWDSINSTILESPICHSIDAAGNGCRLAGGFSNPNNFAAYLVLILPVFVLGLTSVFQAKSKKLVIAYSSIIIAILIMLGLSYARFSWLVLIIIGLLGLLGLLALWINKLHNTPLKNIFKTTYTLTLLIPFLLVFALGLINQNVSKINFLPSFLTKTNSTIDHYKQTTLAIDAIQKKGADLIFEGYGLGQTGPIAKPQYKDVMSSTFAKENIEISNRLGIKPFEVGVPENWYLQLILNGGWMYFLLYMLLIFPAIKPIFGIYKSTQINQKNYLIALGFFGIFIANLFLHVWESPTVGYYMSIVLLVNQNIKSDYR
jgi:hypothetical protein